ncbi:MAG TPA: hypothetical protein VJV78_32155, partial [Polyangiales bacterium]|nr:hypothetical protein [Polyangiales bacterium]
MAFENDQGRKRPTSDPPASLGDLAAGLDDIPGRRAEPAAGGSSSGEEAADEAIDAAALAALSQAQSGRKAGADDAGGSSVR